MTDYRKYTDYIIEQAEKYGIHRIRGRGIQLS